MSETSLTRDQPPLLKVGLESTDYALNDFFKRVGGLKEIEGFNKSGFLALYASDLSQAFNEVKLIVPRINEDIKILYNILKFEERVLQNNLTEIEDDEVDIFANYMDYFIIDIKSLIIWIIFFMDKLPKYLIALFKCSDTPSDQGFEQFMHHNKKGLKNYVGKELNILFTILNSLMFWFYDIKNLRDKYVVHLQRTRSSFVLSEDYISITLETQAHKGKGGVKLPKNRVISNEDIDSFLLVFKKLIYDLNKFLCQNIGAIPFNIKKIK